MGSPYTWGNKIKSWTIDEGWPTSCPKEENTKQAREESGKQEYVHEKKTVEHFTGQHEYSLTPDISMSLPTLDYNLVEDMKKIMQISVCSS